jgi:prepilin-type N-terminal cleavage/methylation domain-containing protein
MKSPNKRSIIGFTIIELLVVISIIAILLGILMPVVVGARQKAQDAQNAANLHQLGIAFHEYAADNDGAFPAGLRTFDPSQSDPAMQVKPASGLGWAGLVFPYSGGENRIFGSPTDTGVNKTNGTGISYAMNSNCAAKNIANLTAPSRTVLMFEDRNNAADPRIAVPVTFPSQLSAAGNGMVAAGWNIGCVKYPDGTWFWGIWQSSATAKVTGPDGVPAYLVPAVATARFYTGNLGSELDPTLALPASFTSFNGPHHGQDLLLMADGSVRSERPELVSPGSDATDASCNQGAMTDGHNILPQPSTCSTVYPISAAGTEFRSGEVSGTTGQVADFDATFSTK